MELRNYQKDEIEKVRNAFKRGKKRVLAVLPCGAGKTVLFAYMSSKNIQLSPSNRVLFLVHRKELVDQTVNTFTRFGLMDPRIQVSMVQSLANKVDKIEKPSLIVVDECFPKGTKIQTLNGQKDISTLKNGEYVWSYNYGSKIFECNKITHLFKHKSHKLVDIKLCNGNVITCTSNHPFYIGNGEYEQASKLVGKEIFFPKLNNEDSLFDKQKVKAIEYKKGDCFVYNIEVENNNNYIANGALVHNCHHSTSMTYKKIINKFPTVPLIGLTATPYRLDGKGLGEIFEDMEIGVTAKWLVQNGYLCQYDYYAPKINLQDAKFTTKMGDYDTADVSKKLDEAGIYGDVMKYFDPSKKTIIYAPSLELSKKMTAVINEKYPNLARHFDGDTPKKERQEIVEKFRSGEIRCLCNRDLIGEGFDVPDCDCCMLLRPTKSVSLYIQQAMRCMRPNGNKRAVIYDFVGNCYRHGLPDDDREWNLQGKIKCKNENAEEGVTCRTCKNCFRVYAGSSPICPYCGFNNGKTPKEIKQDEEKELERIVALEAKKKKRQEGMCRSLDDFLKLAEERGYKPGWAYQRAKIRGYI